MSGCWSPSPRWPPLSTRINSATTCTARSRPGSLPRKIHEALLMMVVYAGFPTALTSMVVWKEVLASARRQGVSIDIPE